MTERQLAVGQAIIFVDPVAKQFPALVTAIHTDMPHGCISLVFMSGDETRTDSYGRQIERVTSLQHLSQMQGVHGQYWMFADEEANVPHAPLHK